MIVAKNMAAFCDPEWNGGRSSIARCERKMADGAIDKIPEFEFYCPFSLRAGGVGHDDSLQGVLVV